MKIHTIIFGADGESTHENITTDLAKAKAFLDAYDHEGSVIKIQIDANGPEALDLLNKADRVLKG